MVSFFCVMMEMGRRFHVMNLVWLKVELSDFLWMVGFGGVGQVGWEGKGLF